MVTSSYILALETSCDETSAAVVAENGEVLSNVVSSQIETHRATGGIVPEVASRLQLELVIPVVEQAMVEAKIQRESICKVAVTSGPGLIGPLLVGTQTAAALAYALGVPLVPVNHLAGHVYACLYQQEFVFPYLALIVSGNHTELVRMDDHHSFEVLGSTRDDAAGEAFDKVARLLGMEYPGGPRISVAASSGDARAYDFPRAMLNQDNLDFSFSGLKSAVRREVADRIITELDRANVAAAFQEAVVDILVEKTVRAAKLTNPAAVLLGGGVAANTLLRSRLDTATDTLDIPLQCSPLELATDNAAMIGVAAVFSDAVVSPFEIEVDPSRAIDAGAASKR
jgi:N6-L-threonylcarbamoyladenine synthase